MKQHLDSKYFPELKEAFDTDERVLDACIKTFRKSLNGVAGIFELHDRAKVICAIFQTNFTFRPKDGKDLIPCGIHDSYYNSNTKSIHLAYIAKHNLDQFCWAFPHELAHHILYNTLKLGQHYSKKQTYEEKCYTMWRLELLTMRLAAFLAIAFFPETPYTSRDYNLTYRSTENILNMCLLLYES